MRAGWGSEVSAIRAWRPCKHSPDSKADGRSNEPCALTVCSHLWQAELHSIQCFHRSYSGIALILSACSFAQTYNTYRNQPNSYSIAVACTICMYSHALISHYDLVQFWPPNDSTDPNAKDLNNVDQIN